MKSKSFPAPSSVNARFNLNTHVTKINWIPYMINYMAISAQFTLSHRICENYLGFPTAEFPRKKKKRYLYDRRICEMIGKAEET